MDGRCWARHAALSLLLMCAQAEAFVATPLSAELSRRMPLTLASSLCQRPTKRMHTRASCALRTSMQVAPDDLTSAAPVAGALLAAAPALLLVPGMGTAWKYFLAGGLCAAASHAGTVPIDVVKTRLQTDPNLRNANMQTATSLILQQDGLNALLGGVGSTVIGYLIQGALKYGLYEIFKPLIFNANVIDNRLVVLGVAAALADLFGSTALCPFEATRIRLVSDPAYGKEVLDALPKMLAERGIGIFSSLPAILLKQLPYTVTQLVTFELLTQQAYVLVEAWHLEATAGVALGVSSSCALVAAVASSLASQPGDCVLSEVNKGSSSYGGDASANVSVASALQAMSLPDLFRGTQARLVHMMTIVTVQLVLYDKIKVLVGLQPTGAAH